MTDDLSSAVSEASQSLENETKTRAKKKRKPKKIPAFITPLVLLLLLGSLWVGYGPQALERSGILTSSEIQVGVNEVLGQVAASVNEYYRRVGALPEAPTHGYLAYAITYQATGPREYTLSYELNGMLITHTYQV